MASVSALVAHLAATISAPETSHTILTDLRTLCRNEAVSHELLLSCHALETLAAFAGVLGPSVPIDVAVALLELLATLACDRHINATERLTAYPSLLTAPLDCLRVVSAMKTGPRRLRLLRLALELVTQLRATTAGRQESFLLNVLTTLLQILENAHDDVSLLQRAAEIVVLDLAITGTHAAVHNAVPIFLRILSLDTMRETMELKRLACEALRELGTNCDLVPIIAANHAIATLTTCLRSHCSWTLETAMLQLLWLLCDESQVFGHVMQENVIPILFEILARDPTADATNAICRVLEGTVTFAVGGKLDIAAFVVNCHGSVFVHAVTMHCRDRSLVTSAFRFFATILLNATELPQFMNTETLEGLLSLFIVQSESVDLGSILATILARLNRRLINTLVLEHEDSSLPALFLCLRSHTTNLPCATNVYAIITGHWRSRVQPKTAHVVSGFIGIAVEILLQHCAGHGDGDATEVIEVYEFLRVILESDDGGDIVLACGGLSLSRALGLRFPKRLTDPVSHGDNTGSLQRSASRLLGDRRLTENSARRVHQLLNQAIATAVRQSPFTVEKTTSYGTGGVNIVDGDQGRRTTTVMTTQQTDRSSDDDSGMSDAPLGDDDPDDEANDDGSDSDGDEENEPQSRLLQRLDLTGTLSACSSERQLPPVDLGTPKEPLLPNEPTNAPPRHRTSSAFERVDLTKLTEHAFFYTDDHGLQYPRHPTRGTAQCESSPVTEANAQRSDCTVLLCEPPLQPEHCRPPESSMMTTFVEQAARRRDEFLMADPETRARLVYENTAILTTSSAFVFDSTACMTTSLYNVPETSKAFAESPMLTFDSWFESGNLERAIQIGDYEYDLVLRRDLFTTCHTQWFYFAVSNVQRRRYRFNILNLCKPDSLFNQGLQPVVYSVRDAREKRVGWRRAGEDVYYFSNPFVRTTKQHQDPTESRTSTPENNNSTTETATETTGKPMATYYTLTFTIEFTNTDDTYLLAHSYPFTFTDHQRHLDRLLQTHRVGRRRTPSILQHSVLCTTLDGRPCDLLTISDFGASSSELASRRAVMLTARVHPGETQASWIMRGLIDFLVGSSETARLLRRLFVFYIVPMLNPDGVFHGNSRCSLSACDLNRHWHDPSPHVHPTIYHLKTLVKTQHSTRGIVMFCDLHGHSRKKNVFMYGCDTKKRSNPRARTFAKLVSTHPSAKRLFSYVDCSFKVSKDKETTARVVLTKELKLCWCFTLEASFGGASFGELQDAHFNTVHLRQVGAGLVETLVPASLPDVGLRERVVSYVDDASVSLVEMVDHHMCELGIVSGVHAPPPLQVTTAPMPRKDKGPSEANAKVGTRKDTKTRRRRTLGVPPDEEKKAVASGPKTARRGPPKRSSSTNLSRRKSSPSTVSEELRGDKKPTRTRPRLLVSTTTTTIEMPAPMTISQPKGKPLLDLLGSLEVPDEEDTQLFMLQSMVRGARGQGSTPMVGPVTPPRVLSSTEASPSFLLHRRLAAAPPRHADESGPTASLFRCSGRDGVPVILPPPISDLHVARSPKAPSKILRFKGAGRQYAALTPSPKAAHPVEFVTPGSTHDYQCDLINTSTISLKHRASSSVLVPAAPTSTTDPLPFRSTTTTTFPTPLLPRHSIS